MSIDRKTAVLEDEISGSVEALTQALPPEWITAALNRCARRGRNRRLPPYLVVWILVLLCLHRRMSYVNLLARLVGSSLTKRLWPYNKAPGDSSFVKARDRLGAGPLRTLFHQTAAEWLQEGRAATLHGYRILALDSSILRVPDSPENRAHFGLPGSTRGRSGYPAMKFSTLLDVGGRRILAASQAKFRTNDIALARQLVASVPAGSIVIMDRGHNAHDLLWDIRQRGSHYIVRAKSSFIRRVRITRVLGPGDYLGEAVLRPSYANERPDMPRTIQLRIVQYRVGRGSVISLVTSLRCPATPASEIAEAYGLRWHHELALDEIKTHLCQTTEISTPVAFRSTTPERVEQEFYALLIAYNAVRATMSAAALTMAADPLRLSFVGTLERLREAAYEMGRLPTERLPARFRRLLETIASLVVPWRPDRKQPRAVKRKYSSYPVLRARHAA